MKGSGTVRRGGLLSKLRMSFVFSAGNEEEKRQSETEKREKQKASSKISAKAQLSVTESKLRPDKNHTHMHAQNKFTLLVKRNKKPKTKTRQLLPCSSPTQFNPQISKHSLKGKYYYLALQRHKR